MNPNLLSKHLESENVLHFSQSTGLHMGLHSESRANQIRDGVVLAAVEMYGNQQQHLRK